MEIKKIFTNPQSSEQTPNVGHKDPKNMTNDELDAEILKAPLISTPTIDLEKNHRYNITSKEFAIATTAATIAATFAIEQINPGSIKEAREQFVIDPIGSLKDTGGMIAYAPANFVKGTGEILSNSAASIGRYVWVGPKRIVTFESAFACYENHCQLTSPLPEGVDPAHPLQVAAESTASAIITVALLVGGIKAISSGFINRRK